MILWHICHLFFPLFALITRHNASQNKNHCWKNFNQNSKRGKKKMRKKHVALNSNLKFKQKKMSLPTSMTKTNIWPHVFVLICLIVTACSGNCIDKVLNKIGYNRIQTIWRKKKKICHVVENLSMLASMSTLACYFRYSIFFSLTLR